MSPRDLSLEPGTPAYSAPEQDLAELDAFIGEQGHAEHPEPCPCEACRKLCTPELVQAVLWHLPSLEEKLNRFLPMPVEVRRSYRTRSTDDGDATEVSLVFVTDQQADQLSLDERRVSSEVRERLIFAGFYVEQTKARPPTFRLFGYYGGQKAFGGPGKPTLAKTAAAAPVEEARLA